MKPLSAALCLLLAPLAGAHAQSPAVDLPVFDPVLVAAAASDLLLRAPDRDVDQLFRAVHASTRSDQEAAALCAMFDTPGGPDLPTLQRGTAALGPDSRQRFADALAAVAIGGLQGGPAQDPAAGHQAVKSAGAKAAFLHDGFVEGLSDPGTDADGRARRCRAFRWLVDALEGFPLAERAAATRYLLAEGLGAWQRPQ